MAVPWPAARTDPNGSDEQLGELWRAAAFVTDRGSFVLDRSFGETSMMLLHEGPSSSPLDDSAAGTSTTQFILRLHGGPCDGRDLRITNRKCTIGRAESCTLRLDSEEFEPLHCLLVRGTGGVVARNWNCSTTLNGQDFTVSWLKPGDRLGLGGIELELLPLNDDTTEQNDAKSATSAQPVPTDSNWPLDVAMHRSEPSSQSAGAIGQLRDELSRVQEESGRTQEFLSQLLGERQELLERLDALQHEVERSQIDADSARDESPSAAERQHIEAAFDEQRQQYESELRQARADRDRLSAVVAELRDEIDAAVRLRQAWDEERSDLERRLEQKERESLRRPDSTLSTSYLYRDDQDETEESGCEVDQQGQIGDERNEASGFTKYWQPDREQAGSDDQAGESTLDILARYGLSSASAEEATDNTVASEAVVPIEDLDDERLSNDAAALANESEQRAARRAATPPIDLSAMRDVANSSARVAIDQAAHRRGLQLAASKWLFALCAMAIGGTLHLILHNDLDLARVLVGLCSVMAAWWFCAGALCYRRAVLVSPRRRPRDTK